MAHTKIVGAIHRMPPQDSSAFIQPAMGLASTANSTASVSPITNRMALAILKARSAALGSFFAVNSVINLEMATGKPAVARTYTNAKTSLDAPKTAYPAAPPKSARMIGTKKSEMTFTMMLKNKPGVLSAALTIFAGSGANILTINQNIPINGCAAVSVTAEVSSIRTTLEQLLEQLRELEGMVSADVLAG